MRSYRIGVIGASSLRGKELSEEIGLSAMAAADIVLLDDDAKISGKEGESKEAAGQLGVSGDEISFIHRLEASSFEGLDFAFFTGDAATVKSHWGTARHAGASIIDMTFALEDTPEVLVRGPWAAAGGFAAGVADAPDLRTPAVVSAHPAAVMLARVAAQLQSQVRVLHLSATLMVPASEYGSEGMDELHQQTVSLLSFSTLPKAEYDAQAAFNLLPAAGEEGRINLALTAERVRKHYHLLGGGKLPPLDLQVLHAPVFHGYAASVLVELGRAMTLEEVETALDGEHIEIVVGEVNPPTNVSAAGQGEILTRVGAGGGDAAETGSDRVWLWLAADNLKLAARNALACAGEMQRLRPLGKVQ